MAGGGSNSRNCRGDGLESSALFSLKGASPNHLIPDWRETCLVGCEALYREKSYLCRCSTEMSPQLLNRNVTPRSPAPRSRRVGDVKRFASRGAWVTEHGLPTRG